MNRNRRIMFLITGIFGAFGIVIGAFGAHYLKVKITPSSLTSFQTGVNYHFYHTLAALLILSLSNQYESKKLKLCFWFFIVGIVCFSGSIYLLSTKELHQLGFINILGPITPIGGLFFILGWLSLCWAFFEQK